ncbi:hypothetical protein PTSG_11713 [Salpingoeca rosetta]|uniref:SAM domain-containing protein n=1 Tax=Salpingoeca rosetta (strain ATCC 50818 / BSB-021) TaxID=946362 RepID=F2U044_SALR5|nr:uncharacterized protein PTSG_11713 [Salpingoeca rosetta]EGD80772.1 hypothetical protein PTSG_11713 [Salpingoeca rosetta]|eukprot:XP_004997333.1 hypothetical protein PTSG_11713 [Salpingoeca rosetta]
MTDAMTDGMRNGVKGEVKGGMADLNSANESLDKDESFGIDLDLDLTQSLSASMLLGIKQVMLAALAGSTPFDIHAAAALGDCDGVQAALQEDKTAVSKRNWCGWTPLIYAAHMGHDSIVDILLDHGASPNETTADGKDSALLQAASMGKESVIDTLLQRGADVNESLACGKTPLYVAAANGQTHVVKQLIERGADVHSVETTTGNTPLLAAIHEGSAGSVRALLDAGADITVRNNKGFACEEAAQKSPQPDVTIMNLIKMKANNTSNDGPMRSEAALVSSPLPSSPPRSRASSHTRTRKTPPKQPSGRQRAAELNLGLGDVRDVHELLKCLNLEKYIPVFDKAEVDFKLLLNMSEHDLKEIGIAVFGPRRKIYNAVQRLKAKSTTPTNHTNSGSSNTSNATITAQPTTTATTAAAATARTTTITPPLSFRAQKQSPSLSVARANASPPKLYIPTVPSSPSARSAANASTTAAAPHVAPPSPSPLPAPLSPAPLPVQRIAPPRLPSIVPPHAHAPRLPSASRRQRSPAHHQQHHQQHQHRQQHQHQHQQYQYHATRHQQQPQQGVPLSPTSTTQPVQQQFTYHQQQQQQQHQSYAQPQQHTVPRAQPWHPTSPNNVVPLSSSSSVASPQHHHSRRHPHHQQRSHVSTQHNRFSSSPPASPRQRAATATATTTTAAVGEGMRAARPRVASASSSSSSAATTARGGGGAGGGGGALKQTMARLTIVPGGKPTRKARSAGRTSPASTA